MHDHGRLTWRSREAIILALSSPMCSWMSGLNDGANTFALRRLHENAPLGTCRLSELSYRTSNRQFVSDRTESEFHLKKPVLVRRVFFFVAINIFLVLACLPESPPSSAPTISAPLSLPTPTPLPPTLTPSPAPTTPPGTVVEAMTVKHELVSIDGIDELLPQFLHARCLVPALYDVDVYRIWFRTRDENDNLIAVQADLRFPRVADPTEFPVFVYGAGTTGIASKCAPLNEQFAGRNWGNYRTHMLSYASQGFITIIANWEGYDDRDRTHPYFVAELEGRVMLDAARAVYSFFQDPPNADILARPSTAVFLGGYSQGGHGAFAAGRIAPSYAPELEIKGLIGHAMSPDVEGLMYDSPRYSPYIVYAYRKFYGEQVIDPVDVFLANWTSAFEEDVTSKCIDDVFDYYPNTATRLYTPEFRDALYNDRLAEAFPEFKAKLDLNDSSNKSYPSVPMLIQHGAADPIVKVRTIESFVSDMCSQGHNVTYRLYPGIDHFQTRQGCFGDTILWMRQILDGDTPASNCSRVAAP